MRVKTTVAQLSMDRPNRPSGILVDERASRFAKGRERGNLYVLVDVSGQAAGRDIIANQLAEAIRKAYYGWHGSVTAGLQNAIREANKLLFEDNQTTLPGDRRMAGVSCVVLRASSQQSKGGEEDLFIGQAGPAAVYLAQKGQVTRFPDVSPWLDGVPLEEMDAAALGERRDVNVALFHTQVTKGDTVLLVESELASQIPPQQWRDILVRDSTEATLKALLEAGQGDESSALCVRLDGREVEGFPAQPARPVEEQKRPQPVLPPIGERVASWLDQLRIGERLRAAGGALAASLSSIWGVLLTLLRRMVPAQPGPQQAQERRPTIVKESKSKPRKRRETGRADRAQSDVVQKVLIGVAVAIPLIVAAIVLFAYSQRGQARKAELETLWLEADSRWKQALVTADQATVRVLLNEAEDGLDQLLELQPDHAEAADLRKRIEVLLDELNHVQRISWIGDLKTYPANAKLTRVVVEGVHVLVMDRNAGQVYHHQLDEFQQSLQPDSLDVVAVSKGDQVGNVLVGDLMDMVWMPAGSGRQKANLLILESGGALLEYDPGTGELVALKVAATETWQYPKLVGSYYGRFYLLDPTANQIWRYPPTLDGYSQLPDNWLEAEIDLAGVVDMAIGNSIYLLYADGQIRKLTAGRPDTFDTSDWDPPPGTLTALFTRPPEDTQWVYFADAGNGRIVQCSKEGLLKRQFRLADTQIAEDGDPLVSVTGLFVDEIGGRAYFLSGRKLYMIVLPD